MNSQKKIICKVMLLCSTIFMASSVAVGGDLDYPSRYGKMTESMLNMMDAFASTYRKRREAEQSSDFSATADHHWMPGYDLPRRNAWNPGNRPGYPGMSPRPPGYRSRLDGSWQGRSGEILVIRSGKFRIYQGPERFHEGLIYIDEKHLALRQMNAGVTHRFEYAEKGGRLALRNTGGKLLLYRRTM